MGILQMIVLFIIIMLAVTIGNVMSQHYIDKARAKKERETTANMVYEAMVANLQPVS